MNSLNDKDYQSLAQAIVCDYMDQNVPLRDSLVKVAGEQGFNVHETRRLLETTNVHAHLSLFKQAEDKKYVEFDVIDPNDVCGELFGRVNTSCDDGPHEKVASLSEADLFLDLPDEHYNAMEEQIEKTAASLVPDVEEEAPRGPYDGDRGYHAYSLVNKVANELENKVLELHQDYTEALEKLSSEFKSVYAADFTDFEKDAYALHGDDAKHVIHSVCGLLRREPTNVKVANHYVIETPAHEKLAHAVSTYKDLKRHIRGFQWYEKQAELLLDD